MRIKLSIIKEKLLPKSLFIRSALILLAPLVIVQMVLEYTYFERHTHAILRSFSLTVSGDVAMIVNLWHKYPQISFNDLEKLAKNHLSLDLKILNKPFSQKINSQNTIVYYHLKEALEERITVPYSLHITPDGKNIVINVDVSSKQRLVITTPKGRLFSHTTILVLVWTSVSAILLFIVAILFMRNQIKPLKRLSIVVKHFGEGNINPNFVRIEGAHEIRNLAHAFQNMALQLTKLIHEKTVMLAGISHDLRTILTRFILHLSMLSDEKAKHDLTKDAKHMENILNQFLEYAKDGSHEAPQDCFLDDIMQEICTQENPNFVSFSLPHRALFIKKLMIERCFLNIINNAKKYANHLWIHGQFSKNCVTIHFDDDGPGINPACYGNITEAFFRIDSSRNMDTGSVGLGLSIVKNVMNHHRGDVSFDISPQKGLRVTLIFPPRFSQR